MNVSADLFDLIKSLTKSEKRYFKLFASLQHGNKTYLKLFDAIDKMKTYDESVIKRKFHNEQFIKQLTFTKNYLYNSVIKSLIAFNNEKSVDQVLSAQLAKVRLLYHKSLFTQFYAALAKVKKMARKYERDYIYLEAIRLEIQAEKTKEYRMKDESYMIPEEQQLIKKITSLHSYSEIYMDTIKIMRSHGFAREENSYELLDGILDKKLLKEKNVISSVREKYYMLSLCVRISILKGDMENALTYSKRILSLIEDNPEPFENDNHSELIHAYKETLYTCLKLEMFDEYDSYFSKFKQIKPKSILDEINIFENTATLEILKYLTNGEFDKGIAMMKSIEEGLKKYEGKIPRDHELVLLYYICKFYLGAGRYEQALKYSNILLSHPLVSIRPDVYCYARIINLIVHYELGNDELLQYLIKSVYKFLIRRERLYKFETVILNFLRKLPGMKSNEDFIENLSLLRKEMITLYKDPQEKNVFIYFDFISWVESKIGNTTFETIVKKKLKISKHYN
jgi:hypothetical protein